MDMPSNSQLAKDPNNYAVTGIYAPGVGSVNTQAGTVSTDTNNLEYAPVKTEIATTGNTVKLAAGATALIADVTGQLEVTTGGIQTTPVAAAAAALAIKATPGRLHKVLVTTLGTAALVFYDNATAASGTIIGVIAASAPAGTVTAFDMPAAAGIWCASGTSTPAVTISWS